MRSEVSSSSLVLGPPSLRHEGRLARRCRGSQYALASKTDEGALSKSIGPGDFGEGGKRQRKEREGGHLRGFHQSDDQPRCSDATAGENERERKENSITARKSVS